MWKETDEELIKKLKSGNFDHLYLSSWFNNYNFRYIYAAIEGAEKKNDYITLFFIYKYAKYFMKNSNISDWSRDNLIEIIKYFGAWPCSIDEMTKEELEEEWNNKLAKHCESIISSIAMACINNLKDNYYDYSEIYSELENSGIDRVRLICCANGPIDKINKFKEDKNERIRKVYNIRLNFKNRYSPDKKYTYDYSLINYFDYAIKCGIIELFDGCVGYAKEDMMYAQFTSPIFSNSTFKGNIVVRNFDEDVFYTIKDKKILASYLVDIINERNIKLNNDLLPQYLVNDNTEKQKVYYNKNFYK